MTQFLCTRKEPIVTVKQGKLRGYFFDGVYRFLGVPYAKAKRFEMPEEPDCWEGVRNALAYGKICPILHDPTPDDEVIVPHRFWPESEHCQNLNVFSSSLDPNAKKPVMVWFHGGGYSTGSAIEHVAYEGDSLAKYDDVVTVCVNHRLNVFGHLDLSAFGEKFHNSVNVGIADLVASLQWVKENIAAFGGDPDNVTIFGQSGGGGKVTTLGQTPAADGLFHKAIVMSGIFEFGRSMPEADPKEFALEILHQLHLGDGDIEKLQKVNYRLLIMAVNRAVNKFLRKGFTVNWAPHANDWYVGDPLEVGFRDHYLTIPTMISTCLAEFSRRDDFTDKEKVPVAEREACIKSIYGEEVGQKLLDLYRKAYPGKNELYLKDVDTASRTPSVRYAKEKAAGSGAVYLYLFASSIPYDGGRVPWHCADIPFAFHNASVVPFTYCVPNHELLEKQFVGAYVNFARSGDPNNEYLPTWGAVTPDSAPTMVFDEKSECKIDFDAELLEYKKANTPPFKFEIRIPEEDEEEEGRAWLY
ncbi:MAG: carboxylesterase/lipase family protein [Clostridia bacterium]|nr:carboxylesterase/lipase family protein [Clostridia bacterium]